jgi:GTP cyclohydrolase I
MRVAKLFTNEFTAGLRAPDFKTMTFAADGDDADQLVSVCGVRCTSVCRHHHLPVIGYAHFGYIPKKLMIGLSKIPRTIQWIAAQPSVQEELTREILDTLVTGLNPRFAAVSMIAQHHCMACRGVMDYESRTITNAFFTGAKSKEECRSTMAEFERAIDTWFKSKGIA